MIKTIYSDHAIYQIKERKISKRLIALTLKSPDRVILQFNFRKKAVKQFKRNSKRYLIVVVYEEQHATQKIITAFITSKVKKYLID